MRLRLLVWLVLVLLFSFGCTSGVPAATETAESSQDASETTTPTHSPAADTPAPTLTRTPSPSPTPSPTQTLTPFPSETPSPTEPPWVEGIVIAEVLKIYRGPNYAYDSIGALVKGINLHIIGVEPELIWGQIDLGFGQLGWVKLDGVDWDGALLALPQPEPPPSPTPTFTPIPPPQVTRLSRWSGGWYISLGGLQPDETVSFFVYDSTGKLISSATAVADKQGRVVNLTLRRPDNNYKITGTYNFFFTGTGGWTLSLTRSYP